MEKVTTLLFFGFCLIGCTYQVGGILARYLNYGTQTQVRIKMQSKITVPDLSFCVRYLNIMNGGLVLNIEDNHTEDLNLIGKLSLKEIFKHTPQKEDVFERCVIREANGIRMKSFNKSQCEQEVTIYKFYVQTFMCYRFILKHLERVQLNPNRVGRDLRSPGRLVLINFNFRAFKAANRMKIIVSESTGTVKDEHRVPHNSIILAPFLYRIYDSKTGKADFNMFSISYVTHYTTLLKAPYKTKCINYIDMHSPTIKTQADCHAQCLLQLVKKRFNKLPYSYGITENYDLKHIGMEDIENETVANFLAHSEDRCDLACHHDDCFFSQTITSVSSVSLDGFLIVQVDLPREPSVLIDHHPETLLPEVLVFVLSCIGTWFGISVMSFDALLVKLVKLMIRKQSSGERKKVVFFRRR